MEIINSEIVLNEYGEWPPFHDASVLSLNFERGENSGQFSRLTSSINIFTVKPINTGTPDYELVFDKNHVLTLEFNQIDDLVMNGFNHQNVIDDLKFNPTIYGIEVEFESIHGVQLNFKCQEIIALSLVEFAKLNA